MRKQLMSIIVLMLLSASSAFAVQTYAVGDNLKVNLQLQQDHTGEPSADKHLEYLVINAVGDVIAGNRYGPFMRLNSFGDYIKVIGDPSSGAGIIVTRDWFQAGTGPTGTDVKEWSDRTPRAIRTGGDVSTVTASSVSLTKQGVAATERKSYMIEMTGQQGGKVSYTIFGGGELRRATDASPGGGRIGGAPRDGTGCSGEKARSERITCTDGTFVLSLQLSASLPAANQKAVVQMNFNSGSGTDPCSDGNKLKTQPFRLTFNVYDSDQHGQPMEQLSIDPITGQEVTGTFQIQVVCARNNDEDFKAAVTGVPRPVREEEVLAGLGTLLQNLVTEEARFKTELEAFTQAQAPTGTAAEQARAVNQLNEQIREKLRGLAQAELTAAGQLQRFLQPIQNAQDIRIKGLHTPLLALHTILKAPTDPVSPTSIHTPVTAAITSLAELAQEQQIDFRKIGEAPAPVITKLAEVIDIKNGLLTNQLIAAGLPGGIVPGITGTEINCPHQQTDAEGNYYVCVPSNQPAGIYEPTQQTCPRTQENCLKLKYYNHCYGDDGNMRYQCKPTIEEGWEPYLIDYVTTKICPNVGDVCQEQSTYGVRISPQEQLIEIKRVITRVLDAYPGRVDPYEKGAVFSDEEASTYLTSQKKNELRGQIVELSEVLKGDYQELDRLIKQPVEGTSLVPKGVRDFVAAIDNGASYLYSTETYEYSTTAIKYLDEATTPGQIKQVFHRVMITLKTLFSLETILDPDPIWDINFLLEIKPDCPNDFLGTTQYSCFFRSCPSAFYQGEQNQIRNWVADGGHSCGAQEVCCRRNARPALFYKTWDYIEDDYSEYLAAWLMYSGAGKYNYFEPEYSVLAQLRIPYQEPGTITDFKFSKIGGTDTPVTDINYDVFPDQKIAVVPFDFNIGRTTSYLFEYRINDNPLTAVYEFRLSCPTHKNPMHRVASHACLSSGGDSRYPRTDGRYVCEGSDVYCYREPDQRAPCVHAGPQVRCVCYTRDRTEIDGVRGTRLAGQTALEACRDVCTIRERNTPQQGSPRQYRGSAC